MGQKRGEDKKREKADSLQCHHHHHHHSSSVLLVTLILMDSRQPRLFLLCWQLQSRPTYLRPVIPICIYFCVYFNIWACVGLHATFSFCLWASIKVCLWSSLSLCVYADIHNNGFPIYTSFLKLKHRFSLYLHVCVCVQAHTCTVREREGKILKIRYIPNISWRCFCASIKSLSFNVYIYCST